MAFLTADVLAAALASALVLLLFGRWYVPAVLPAGWVLCLVVQHAYQQWCLRTGREEFRRVLRAAGLAAVAAGAVWWLTPGDELLHDVLFALPITAALTIVLRRLQRRRMRADRDGGRPVPRMLVVGPARACAQLISLLQRRNIRELDIVGACLPGDLLRALEQCECDAVIALPGPEMGTAGLRQLSWQLQAEKIDLLLAPVPADVAAERLEVREVAGLPLLQIRAPVLSGLARVPKDVADRLFAALGIVALSPVLLLTALLVRLTSPGPALFLQRRTGLNGRSFTVVKFRTMYRDAEKRKVELAALNQYRDGPLFKIANDPRITPLGSFLRRYSLDELPQLFNVVAGHMSLIGPRPPLPEEVVTYSREVRRRLLVKPGMTGLWQVSGRSSLSWEEAVRLDLSYVENWSPALDLNILMRTASAVIHGTGAY